MNKHKSKTEDRPAKQPPNRPDNLPLDRSSYRLMVVGLVFIVIGFILMSGGGSDDPNVFDHSIFNFRRTTLAPILVLIGYGIEMYAILKKPEPSKV